MTEQAPEGTPTNPAYGQMFSASPSEDQPPARDDMPADEDMDAEPDDEPEDDEDD